MRKTRWMAGLFAAIVAAACGGGGGPSGPGPDVREYDVTHTFTLTDDEGASISFSCTGSVRFTVGSSGNVTGTVTIDPCETAQIVQTITVPLESGATLQGTAVTFRIAGQDQILGSVEQEFGCETVQGGNAFTGTLTESAVDADIEVQFACDGEQIQGNLTVTWRIQGARVAD